MGSTNHVGKPKWIERLIGPYHSVALHIDNFTLTCRKCVDREQCEDDASWIGDINVTILSSDDSVTESVIYEVRERTSLEEMKKTLHNQFVEYVYSMLDCDVSDHTSFIPSDANACCISSIQNSIPTERLLIKCSECNSVYFRTNRIWKKWNE